jgi:uncharacterized heparinase superfamily protein
LFPELPEAKRWGSVACTLLEEEIDHQFLADGGGIEQAFGYHLFITDLCNLVSKLLEAKGKPSVKLSQTVDRAIDFLAALFEDNWKLPSVGDNDGGYALSPYLRISHKKLSSEQRLTHCNDSGYSLIRHESCPGRLIVFDRGPLGMSPSYGHGHSDALAMIWREQGDRLLTDPGTYTYTGDEQWRRYFRGVTAHNTVSVDRQDQAVQQSTFMWSQPFECKRIDVPETMDGHLVVAAAHSGYLRIGLMHHRAVITNACGAVLVWDFLNGKASVSESHEMSLWWHLGGDLSFDDNAAGQYLVTGKHGAGLRLEIQGGECCHYFGDDSSPQGWVSPIYGRKQPSHTVETRFVGNIPHEFFTYIFPASATVTDQDKNHFDKIITKLKQVIV